MIIQGYLRGQSPRVSVLPAAFLLALLAVFLGAVCTLAQQETPAEPAPAAATDLAVAEIALGHDYDTVRKAVIDTASVFAADVGKVVCYTRITGATSPTRIQHVWYHEGQSKAQVELAVGSPNWRTYSSKRLLPSWTGQWEVKVLDENSTVLATAAFTVR